MPVAGSTPKPACAPGAADRRHRLSILRPPASMRRRPPPAGRLTKNRPALSDADDVYSSHIHADDLAAACIAARAASERNNRAYNVVDDSDLRMGGTSTAWPPPFQSAAAAAPIACRRPRQDLSPLQMSFMRESRRIGNRRLRMN